MGVGTVVALYMIKYDDSKVYLGTVKYSELPKEMERLLNKPEVKGVLTTKA